MGTGDCPRKPIESPYNRLTQIIMYFLAHNGVDLKKFPLEDDYGVL